MNICHSCGSKRNFLGVYVDSYECGSAYDFVSHIERRTLKCQLIVLKNTVKRVVTLCLK